MPRYHKLGKIPHKRHTTFKKANGGYHYEELFGTPIDQMTDRHPCQVQT